MIENMRKYTGLMVVVFVLLGAGFLFTMNDIGTGNAGGSGPAILEVHGQSLDRQAYLREGERTLQLCTDIGMHSYVNFLLVPDAQAMQSAFQMSRLGFNYYNLPTKAGISQQELDRFIANRIILQHAYEEMGLYASENDISEAVKALPIFSQNGKYNEQAYLLFVEKRLGRLGMTEKNLRDLARENLCLNKLINLLGGGLTPSRSATQDQLEAQMQTVTLAKIVFNRDDFVEKENPTEDEIKTFWEAHQDAYKTDEQRRISYYYINIPEEDEETLEEDKKEEASADTEDAEAAKKAAEAKIAEATAKREKRAAAAKALKNQINKFYDKIIDNEENKLPLNFATAVEEVEGKAVKSELFTSSTLPEELKDLTLRSTSSRGRPLSDVIFNMSMSDKEYNRVSAPLPVGEHGWLVFVLEEIVEPEALDYTAARNKARAQLVGKNATEKVKQAAKDARDEVLELMKGGKDFDTAAREKGLTPVQVGPFSSNSTPPQNEPNSAQLHRVASGLNPGDVSDPINENNRSLFIYVEKRELEDAEENKLRVDNAMQGTEIDFMIRTFLNWINHQFQEAEVKRLTEEG